MSGNSYCLQPYCHELIKVATENLLSISEPLKYLIEDSNPVSDLFTDVNSATK
jgi:hypothetical protein